MSARPAPERGILTGAALVVQALEELGVEVAFGLPGTHNLALWRALGGSRVRLVGVRHEQTAAYAADGYARAGGRLGVALTTTGPGAANALAAVGEAWASRGPLLLIATDVSTAVRRPGVWRGALHEASDQTAMFLPVVKHAERVARAEALRAAVLRAGRAALAAPSRPAYVEVPTDLLSAAVDARAAEPDPAPPAPPAPPARERVERAVELLADARRPLVWAGGGAVGAGAAVGAAAERLGAPVLTTYAARGLLPPTHPCLAPASAHLPAVGALWDEADCVLAVGTDFDAMTTQAWALPQPPRLVAVNVDGADAAKNLAPDVLLEADAGAALGALLERLPSRAAPDGGPGPRLRTLREAIAGELRREEPEAAALLDAFAEALPPDAVVVCDMCIPAYWLGGFHAPTAPRRLLYPLGWGTLGCAFPQALGAALAVTGPVVSLSGDGGFLFACGELATVAQERIPLTAVVVDDGGYGMLRHEQEGRGHARLGVDLDGPDLPALAASFGVAAVACDGLGADFAAALSELAARPGPSLLAARAALRPPPNVSPRWYRRSA